MNLKLSLAPLQGITDFYFRNALAKYFGGIDVAYTPYLRFQKGEIKKSSLADILPENNKIRLVPQILSNKPDEILYFDNLFHSLGYTEMNWNLGCPYPMVAKHQLGSGLLAFPALIDDILQQVIPKMKLNFSVKMRSGYETPEEFEKVLEVLNKYPLTEIIFHPRYGKQLYKGKADVSLLAKAQSISNQSIAYNGDISSVEFFNSLQTQFPNTEHFMIGRALIANPFLAAELKGLSPVGDKIEIFRHFHNELFSVFEQKLSGSGHILSKMLALWEYFSLFFADSHKTLKIIKKANSVPKYKQAANSIFHG